MNTDSLLKRAYAHWLEDGSIEIMAGVLFFGVGALRAALHFAGAKSTAYYGLLVVLLLFMVGFGWGGTRVVESLKARLSYSRTGYITFRKPTFNLKRLLALFILAGVLGGLVGVLATQPNQRQVGASVPVGMGIVWALAFSSFARWVGVRRLYILAACSVVIGLLLGTLGVDVVLGLSFFYAAIGLALIASGCVVLARFLRQHARIVPNGERP